MNTMFAYGQGLVRINTTSEKKFQNVMTRIFAEMKNILKKIIKNNKRFFQLFNLIFYYF